MKIKRTFDILPYALATYPLDNCLVSKELEIIHRPQAYAST